MDQTHCISNIVVNILVDNGVVGGKDNEKEQREIGGRAVVQNKKSVILNLSSLDLFPYCAARL